MELDEDSDNCNSPENFQSRSGRKSFKTNKQMGPPCECRARCFDKINEEQREKIHNNFWNNLTSWTKRRKYICSLVYILPIERRTTKCNESRKNFSRKYTLRYRSKSIVVCKSMFLNTLAISPKFVDYTLLKTDKLQTNYYDVKNDETFVDIDQPHKDCKAEDIFLANSSLDNDFLIKKLRVISKEIDIFAKTEDESFFMSFEAIINSLSENNIEEEVAPQTETEFTDDDSDSDTEVFTELDHHLYREDFENQSIQPLRVWQGYAV